MTQLNKLAGIMLIGLIMGACKEETPEINPCLNGKLDAGETQIDCGGSCSACPDTEFPAAGCVINGENITISGKTLTHDAGGWRLHLSNDSLDLNLNLGNSGALGNYVMSPVDCSAMYRSEGFPILAKGNFIITEHNTTTKKMSAYFTAKFAQDGTEDTLYINNGYIEFLPY